MIEWIWHRVGNRNFLSYLLLLIALVSVAYGLSVSIFTISLTLMCIVALIGLTYGWMCSISPLKDWQIMFLTLLAGISGAIIYYAKLMDPLIALARAIWGAAGGVMNWPKYGPPELSSIDLAIKQFNAQLGTFFNHIIQWISTLYLGQSGYDKLIISMFWGLVFWLAAVWAGWAVFRRHSALFSVLPAGALLAGTMNYVAGNPLYLIPMVGATLMLVAVTNYNQQEKYWVSHKIDYAEDIRLDLSFVFILLSLGFMAISALAPSFSIRQIISASQKITQSYQSEINSIAKSLGLEPQSQDIHLFDPIREPELPRVHLLGSGPELSKEIAMVVETGDYPPNPSVGNFPLESPRYYWRSTTYDIYTGHGWATSPIEVTKYSSDQAAIEGIGPISGIYRSVHQSVQLTQDLGSLIFSAGQLISVDQDYQVAWRLSPAARPGNEEEQIVDEFAATYDGNMYTADSYIITLNQVGLRSTSGEIPTWINQRYLALPENLPDRVRQLSIDLTEDQPSTYDKAASIESYLRTITYTLDLPSPPTEQDIVDYFLFDLKRGYCDYYATAMVVMSRVIGLPARLVTGYATGLYDRINARYIVSQADAHSWVEIYLAGIGWVEFEPTSGVPGIQRAGMESDIVDIPQIKRLQRFNLLIWFNSLHINWLVILSGSIGTILLAIFIGLGSDRWRLYHLSPSVTIIRLYQRLYRSGHRLAEPFQSAHTPHEYVTRIKQEIYRLSASDHWYFYFERAMDEITQLTNLYTQVVYSPHIPGLADQKTAVDIWTHLHLRLWLAIRLHGLKKISFKRRSDQQEGKTNG